MHPLVVVYLCTIACVLAHTAAQAVAGTILAADVEEVGVFSGRAIGRFRLGRTSVVVNLVPFGAHVKFREKGIDESTKGWLDLHPLPRILIVASGCLTLFGISLVCLGPAHSLSSTWHGFGQIVRGGLNPSGVGARLVRSLLALVQRSPLSTILGIVAAKQTAANLLPWPPTDGAQVIVSLIQWRGLVGERIVLGANWIGVALHTCLMFAWAYACAFALFL